MSVAASDLVPSNIPVATRDGRAAAVIAEPRLMVFIPAYRCAAQVKRVIAQFAEIGESLPCLDRVVVVDNQSPDDTIDSAADAFRQLEGSFKKIILRNCDNYGLGGSHKAAFRYAKEAGMDYLLVLHGDDQATFEDIVPALRSGEAFRHDCYLGSRFEKGARRQGYSALRTFGNIVYNWLFTIVAGKRITDLGSGLNLYRLSAVDVTTIAKFPDNLTFNYVMLLWSLRKRQNVRFFPISWREEDQRSNVKLVQQAVRVLGLLTYRWLNPGAFFAAEHRTSPKDSYRSDVVFGG